MPRLLFWNVRHGGGARVPGLLAAIGAHRPDVVALGEFRNNSAGAALREGLAALGLVFQRSGRVAARTNTLLLASRVPLRPLPGGAPAGGGHRVLLNEVGGIRLATAYLPVLRDKLPFLERLVGLPARWRRGPALLVGDLNTGRHHVDEPGAIFVGTAFLDRLEAQGWRDGFRRIHGAAREYTWYSHRGNGYRLDHAYATPAMAGRLRDVRYGHRERAAGLSDHAPMIVDYD
jgi:exodeoxyribonuclease-3